MSFHISRFLRILILIFALHILHCVWHQGLIDKAPTASPVAEYTTQPIFLSTPGCAPVCVFPAGTVVPASFSTQATVPGGKGFFQLLSGHAAATPGVEAPKSLVSIFTSAVKAAVSATPAATVEGVLGAYIRTNAYIFIDNTLSHLFSGRYVLSQWSARLLPSLLD